MTKTIRKEPKADDVQIGKRIRACRMKAALSQSDLGEKLGVTFQQIQKYEKGANRVSGSRLLAMCRVLNVSSSFLLGTEKGDNDPFAAMLAKPGALQLLRHFDACNGAQQHAIRALAQSLAADKR